MLFNTAPDGTITCPRLPEATPPAGVFGATDSTYDDGDIRAVVTVRVAMTRDMLAVALDLSGTGEEDPDTWSVPFIRESVEMTITYENGMQLELDAETYPALLDDSSVRDRVQATYRAVDRAYPHLAGESA